MCIYGFPIDFLQKLTSLLRCKIILDLMQLIFLYYYNHRHRVEGFFHRERANRILQVKKVEGKDFQKVTNDHTFSEA